MYEDNLKFSESSLDVAYSCLCYSCYGDLSEVTLSGFLLVSGTFVFGCPAVSSSSVSSLMCSEYVWFFYLFRENITQLYTWYMHCYICICIKIEQASDLYADFFFTHILIYTIESTLSNTWRATIPKSSI